MRKVAIATSAAVVLIGSMGTANAWNRGHGGAIAAGLIGGALIGGLVASAATQPYYGYGYPAYGYGYPAYGYGYGYYAPRYYYPRPIYYGAYHPGFYGGYTPGFYRARSFGPRVIHYRRGFYGHRRHW